MAAKLIKANSINAQASKPAQTTKPTNNVAALRSAVQAKQNASKTAERTARDAWRNLFNRK